MTEIEQIRIRYGISKTQMSKILGVPYTTIQQWCKVGAQAYMTNMVECTLAHHMSEAMQCGKK